MAIGRTQQTADQLFPVPPPIKLPSNTSPFLSPTVGIPTELRSGASADAAAGSMAGKQAFQGNPTQPIENNKPPRATAPQFIGPNSVGPGSAGPQNLIPSMGRGFGIPAGAFDPSTPGGVGRAFAIAPGLVFDPNTPNGVRRMLPTDITNPNRMDQGNLLNEMSLSASGITGLNAGGMNPYYYHPQGTAQSKSQTSPQQAALFQDPNFQAAFNAAREATDARFQTARSQLANRASMTGGFGSGEYLNALSRLNAYEAKQRAQDIMDAAAHANRFNSPVGGVGGSAADIMGTSSGMPFGGGGVYDSRYASQGPVANHLRQFQSDIRSVQGSAPTFAKLGMESADKIRQAQLDQQHEQELSKVLDAAGIPRMPGVSQRARQAIFQAGRARTEEEKRSLNERALIESIRGEATNLGITVPEGITSSRTAKAIVDAELEARKEIRTATESQQKTARAEAQESRAAAAEQRTREKVLREEKDRAYEEATGTTPPERAKAELDLRKAEEQRRAFGEFGKLFSDVSGVVKSFIGESGKSARFRAREEAKASSEEVTRLRADDLKRIELRKSAVAIVKANQQAKIHAATSPIVKQMDSLQRQVNDLQKLLIGATETQLSNPYYKSIQSQIGTKVNELQRARSEYERLYTQIGRVPMQDVANTLRAQQNETNTHYFTESQLRDMEKSADVQYADQIPRISPELVAPPPMEGEAGGPSPF